ncbi:nucleotide disphospho-sugar-binding domain-containing protein [Streptomyces sp. TM32]|uniref:nucleotide disphospho-sugar-binding domain-containing protein n=1 Tax=Streptomyces sp. TM32 TaxID=1652669 RepID=UPI0015759F0F|nr:nucleotide disphospho-sugar-binding domain-containing protein [Streptomyces sp. TM32]
MRLLFTTWAWPSHLYALVTQAWACRAAGHEVLVASQPALAAEIGRCGLPAAVVGQDVDAVAMVRRYVIGAPRRDAGGGGGPRAAEMFLAHAESMTGSLVELADGFRPDVVVYEPTALAGPLAAAVQGVPAVRHLYGTDLLARAAHVLPGMLAPLAERYGLDAVDPFGALTLDPTPPSLRPAAAPPAVPVRYVPYNGGGRPVTLPKPAGPRVCVTWGHTMAKLSARRFLLPDVVRALHPLGVELVAAVSAAQAPLLGRLPEGVRVVVDAPLHGLLDACDLVVAHGGAGTVLTALHHGVPLLLVPQLPDHAGHAGAVAGVGAGRLLPAADATPERLREECRRLLADGAVRACARRLKEEMHRQPPPSARVDDLLSAAHRPA